MSSGSRRDTLTVLLVVLVSVSVVAVTVAVGQDADDWNQYASDSGHTGYNAQTEDVREKPNVVWEDSDVTVGDQPTISNGTIYYWHRGPALVARNITTGQKIWSQYTPSTALSRGKVDSSPAVSDYVYLPHNGITAYDKETSGTVWNKNIDGRSITIYNDIIYAPTGSRIYAINDTTGGVIWNKTVSLVGKHDIAVSDGTVYAAANDSIILLNASTGKKIGDYSIPNTTRELYGAIVNNGLVYTTSGEEKYSIFGESGGVYAVDISTGDLVWRGRGVDVSAVTDDRVYVERREGNLTVLDSMTGGVEWVSSKGPTGGSSVAVANETVYFSAGTPIGGKVYGLDARTGDVLWSFGRSWEYKSTPGEPTTPVVSDETVYAPAVTDGPRSLYALSDSRMSAGSKEGDEGSALGGTAGVVFVLLSLSVVGLGYVVYRRM